MFAVAAANRTTINGRLSNQSSRDKHFKKVHLLIDHIKDELQLNESICQQIKFLYIKAYKQGYPRRLGTGRNIKHFYLTECIGACIYVAALQKRKKYRTSKVTWDKKGRPIYETRRITAEQIKTELNKVKQIVLPEYKEIKTGRIERCAKLMAEEFGLQITIPNPSITFDRDAYVIRKKQLNAIESSIADICQKLNVNKSLSAALKLFESSIRRKKIGLTVNGHLRKPEMVASVFVDLACRKNGEKIKLDRLRKVAGVGRESFFKTKRAIASVKGELTCAYSIIAYH
jgi:transcription initiation factor TFIIIB Brf1 subunit/transcription initiation factor TFIIB